MRGGFGVILTKWFGVGVSCRNLYYFVYLYVGGGGPVASLGEGRAGLSAVVYLYVVSVGEVSSSSGCLVWATLLAHLSRRLIGELIVYQWSGVRRRPSSSVNVRRTSVVHNA